jgi:hypothetical protein
MRFSSLGAFDPSWIERDERPMWPALLHRAAANEEKRDVPVSYLSAERSPEAKSKSPAKAEWAIQDSNLGPLPYQRSALTD